MNDETKQFIEELEEFLSIKDKKSRENYGLILSEKRSIGYNKDYYLGEQAGIQEMIFRVGAFINLEKSEFEYRNKDK